MDHMVPAPQTERGAGWADRLSSILSYTSIPLPLSCVRYKLTCAGDKLTLSVPVDATFPETEWNYLGKHSR